MTFTKLTALKNSPFGKYLIGDVFRVTGFDGKIVRFWNHRINFDDGVEYRPNSIAWKFDPEEYIVDQIITKYEVLHYRR